MKTHYLTDAQFLLIRSLLPSVKTKPFKYSQKVIVNGILYILRTGCQWRELPDKFPPWNTVFKYFRKLVNEKIWDKILYRLNVIMQRVKKKDKLRVNTSNWHILVTDSQSVDSSEYLALNKKGYDGHKKEHGLKRFLLVDIWGLVWAVLTLPANISEKYRLRRLVEKYRHILPKQFQAILADKGFESKLLTHELREQGFTLYAMRSTRRLKRQTMYDYEQNNLHNYLNKQISKLRWIVEQAFAQINKARRLIHVWERKTKNHEGFIKLRFILLVIRRLA
jgi:putative transposase